MPKSETSRRLGTILLLVMFGLALASIREKSPTFDEQGFLTRGLSYLRDVNQHIRVGHPLGLNAINATFLAFDKQVELPLEELAKQETDFHRPSEQFMWEIGNDVRHILFLGRLPSIWLGLFLAALAGRWAWKITHNRWAGLFALFLVALDPNILAHMRLATTDLGLALAGLFAGMTLWSFWQKPEWRTAALAGFAFGLLQNTKFTAGLFVPLFGFVIIFAFFYRRQKSPERALPWKPAAMLIISYAVVSFLTLWASYGFQVGSLPEDLPVFSQLGGMTLPLSHHLEQLLDIGGRLQQSTPSFLLGRYSDSGWWYYFPVAFLLKTSLPVLFLLLWAFWRLGRCVLGRRQDTNCPTGLDIAALLIPPLGYFAIALTSEINLGYRHLLPVLPFLYVFAGVMLWPNRELSAWPRLVKVNTRVVTAIFLAWIAAIALIIFPNFLAFFNVLGGCPDGGWRSLVDSNIDWGQDLEGLGRWLENNDVETIWLSYFGEARPEYYGIKYQGLDGFPPRLINPEAQLFYPSDPAPGQYAISATNLQGVHFTDHDQYAWFREQEPKAKIGFSIFIYDVPARGEAVDLVLGGMQANQVALQDYRRLGSNNVVMHWVDPGQAIIIPGQDPWWFALSLESGLNPIFEHLFLDAETALETEAYQLLRFDASVRTDQPLAIFDGESGTTKLLDVTKPPRQLSPGSELVLESHWLKAAPPEPLKIFLHVVDNNDEIVAQWDGLGVAWEGWRDGDQLWQTHLVSLPVDLPGGTYNLYLGLYDPGSNRRWRFNETDRYYLGQLNIAQESPES